MNDTTKNRQRDAYTFANINMLGRCNCDCFFCLGKDIPELLQQHDQRAVHFSKWRNWWAFLRRCYDEGVFKLYVTGQNTDSLQYIYLQELIDFLHRQRFQVGLRTNGYLASKRLAVINSTDLSVGYSIHSINPSTVRSILGRSDIPNWNVLLTETERPRVQIVVNRFNKAEFWPLLEYIAGFNKVRYIQVRRICSDTREAELTPDIEAHDRLHDEVRQLYPLKKTIYGNAEVYDIYGKEVVFWRTVKTRVNSLNYFTDGTVSDQYFVVEGYQKNCQHERQLACQPT